jgi:zinc transporter, ZIP family
MVQLLTVVALGVATALATGLGAIPVFFLGRRAEAWEPALWGLAAGVMTVASIVGLLLPATDEGSTPEVVAGFLVGVAFLTIARLTLRGRDVHVGKMSGARVRLSVLVFFVLFVHSLPEGFAIGTAYASDTAGLSLFVILAIALQNIPEGTSVAIPMADAGFTRRQQFWAAVLTSAPQPLGAAIAFLLVESVSSLLAVSFAFAAGAMLALVFSDLLPRSLWPLGWRGPVGLMAGALVMLALSAALGV